jgi:hypothetical protein
MIKVSPSVSLILSTPNIPKNLLKRLMTIPLKGKRTRGNNMKKIATMMCVLAIVATIHFRYIFDIDGKSSPTTLVVDKVIEQKNEGVTVIKDGKIYYFPNNVFFYIEHDKGNAIRTGTYNK